MASPASGSWTPSVGTVAAGFGAVAVLAGTGAYAWSAHCRAGKQAKPPANVQWRQVGTLSELYFFPLKSGRSIKATTLEASPFGLRSGALRDRSLVAMDANGKFISARSHPRMQLVNSSIDGNVLTLSCQDNESIGSVSIDLDEVAKGAQFKIKVWDCKVTGVDCGDKAAAWIRKAVVEKAKHGEAGVAADLRLVFYPKEQSDRDKDGNVKDLGIYADRSSYSLVCKKSLEDLNTRLPNPVTVLNFRSNFLVEGPQAYEEDKWDWVRIGDKAIFHLVEKCSRCIMTTVDPETGVKSPDMEPLKTLRKYRLAEGPLRKITKDSPILALWMGIYETGTISVGDSVYVPA